MKRVLSLGLIAIAMIVGSLVTELPANAAVPICTPVSTTSHTYPADYQPGINPGHFFVCFNDNAQREASILGATQGTSVPVRNILSKAGVTFYYFFDRTDMNAYFNATPPYNGIAQYQSSSARCGKTGYVAGKPIAVSIFDNCTIGGNLSQNVDLYNTASHEQGHAYDWSFASMKSGANRNNGPSQSSGFKFLAQQDEQLLDAAWNAQTTQANKDRFICNLFSTLVPSPLEIDLGAHPSTAVCSNSNTVNTGYTNTAPSVIINEKIPYFVTSAGSPLNQEMWAEEFAAKRGEQSGTGPFLELTDRILSNFACTNFVILWYFDFQTPPAMNGPYPSGCTPQDPNNLK